MVVPPSVPHIRVVFRGIQHRISHEFAVLQHPPSILPGVIVPVHHQHLPGGIHCVVIQIPAQGPSAPVRLALCLGIPLLQRLPVLQLRGKKVGRILNIRHPRLPEQVQQIHPSDGDVPQPIELCGVPKHAVHGAPGFQLVPPRTGIRPLESVFLQDHRQNACQLSGLLPISWLPGQHRGLRIAVHGVCVLGKNALHQPPAGGLWICGIAALSGLFHLLPVPQLPELLVVDDPLLQLPLSCMIAAQDICRTAHLLRADPRPLRLQVLFH